MPVHNKLVRDRIPEMIEASGRKYRAVTLSHSDFITELKKKSREELEEYLHATNDEEAIEELADLLEIIHSLAKIHHATIEEVEEVRERKKKTRGGFTNKTFLAEVED